VISGEIKLASSPVVVTKVLMPTSSLASVSEVKASPPKYEV